VNFKNLNKNQTGPKDDVSFVKLKRFLEPYLFTQLSSLTSIHEVLWEWVK